FCECMPGKLNQVFMNLISNGIQAIGHKRALADTPSDYEGKITIRTELCSNEGRGKTACIEIKDNGIGMEKQVSQRIFEPFFTTKDVGSGIGLGLSITFGIIEQHQGNIEVESEPGKGSTFRILIPVQQSPQTDR
ncbi:MAG: ATP-binding protein, partial [Bacteroidota bacterium]